VVHDASTSDHSNVGGDISTATIYNANQITKYKSRYESIIESVQCQSREKLDRSKETREKISKARMGIVFSDKHKKSLSLNHRDMKGENNHNYGKKFSEETKHRLSDSHMGMSEQKNRNRKCVRLWQKFLN